VVVDWLSEVVEETEGETLEMKKIPATTPTTIIATNAITTCETAGRLEFIVIPTPRQSVGESGK
jgi:hypothetical protein